MSGARRRGSPAATRAGGGDQRRVRRNHVIGVVTTIKREAR